jgi:eukaryotic-like serine/threonine-protein kinase
MELSPGTILAGRYLIVRVLGRGAVATVYQAFDRMLDERVAVKVLDASGAAPSAVSRLRSEIKLARRVTHPNVCRIHDYGEDGPHRFICMELIQGRNLRDVLATQGRLPPAAACAVAAQAAAALDAIHARGIVHRDVKPANLIEHDGRVYVTDFGIATGAGPGTAGLASGYAVGTPEYMSPEQAQGLRLDARSDLYALGVVLFEMLTGEVPFRGATTAETLLRHVQEPVPVERLAAFPVSPALRELVERLLAKHRDDRPSAASAVAEALATLSNTERASLAGTPAPRATAASGARAALQTVTLPRRVLRWDPRWTRSAVAFGAVCAALAALAPRHRTTPVPSASAPAPVVTARADEPLAPPRIHGRGTSPAPRRSARRPPSVERPSSQALLPVREVTPLPAPVGVEPRPQPAREPVVIADDARALPAVTRGQLQIGVTPWADVALDGVHVGTTPLAPLPLAPGTYTARFEHPDFKPLLRKVTIRAGETTPLRLDLRQDAIRKR